LAKRKIFAKKMRIKRKLKKMKMRKKKTRSRLGQRTTSKWHAVGPWHKDNLRRKQFINRTLDEMKNDDEKPKTKRNKIYFSNKIS